MTEGLEAITTTALGLALDAAALRQEAIAANIANASTVDYRPLRVNFEAQLEGARMALRNQGRLDASALEGVTPRLEQDRSARALGLSPKAMLDLEVAGMARNAVHYQALVKGLAKHYALLSTAVSDGRK